MRIKRMFNFFVGVFCAGMAVCAITEGSDLPTILVDAALAIGNILLSIAVEED